MDTTSNKDCRHEVIAVILSPGEGIQCRDCAIPMIALTKAQDRLREDAIEAGREYIRSVDNVAPGDILFENLKLLQAKIKALDVEIASTQ